MDRIFEHQEAPVREIAAELVAVLRQAGLVPLDLALKFCAPRTRADGIPGGSRSAVRRLSIAKNRATVSGRRDGSERLLPRDR